MTVETNATGAYGEQLAANHLEALGYRVLARNWRSPRGELDLVALDPRGELAFVEVKTRRGYGFGHPLEAVNALKLVRLRVLAGEWLAANPHQGNVRIDAIAVTLEESGEPRIEHLKAVWE